MGSYTREPRIPGVPDDLERAAIDVAARRKCGAIVRANGFYEVRLCCDPTLAITFYAVESCECLARARKLEANRPTPPDAAQGSPSTKDEGAKDQFHEGNDQ